MSGIEFDAKLIPATEWSSVILPILDQGFSLKIPFSGLSMYPLLVGGRDEAVIASVAGRRLKRGDIVLFVREDGIHVLHRIHHVDRKGYYIIGDAQTWIEGPVNEKNVLAVATSLIRKENTISCNSILYKIFTQIWLFIRPLRPIVLSVIRKTARIRKFGGSK